MREEGAQGQRDSVAGDLYIVLKVKEHPFSSGRGRHHVHTEVGFPTLCLGGEIKVPVLGGEMSLKIPPGTPPEKVFRLKGLGVPKTNGYGKGDQFVHLHVTVPKSVNDRQRELLEELARTPRTAAAPPTLPASSRSSGSSSTGRTSNGAVAACKRYRNHPASVVQTCNTAGLLYALLSEPDAAIV